MKKEYEELSNRMRRAGNIVFFGGAGVSTESGIPDFRSEDGIFAAKTEYGATPEVLISHTCFEHNPKLFFRYYMDKLIYHSAQPNMAHTALAQLEESGKLTAVITQNIDGLHQAAGSKTVYELHGSNNRQFCLDCGAHYDLSYILDTNHQKDGIPKCEKCGGTVRPDVVLYEEPLNDSVVRDAINALSLADMLIVGGTSLVVYPAAGLIRYFPGNDTVLINKSSTPYDSQASLVIHESIGEVLSVAVAAL